MRFRSRLGVTVIEILISLGIFSLAIAGLYIAFQTVSRGTVAGVRNDVEAAVANSLMAQVNVYDLQIEQVDNGACSDYCGYDKTTKQTYSMPDGDTIYWTRDVRSSATTGDIKVINVYFWKKTTDTVPYRTFKREINLTRQAFMLSSYTLAGTPSRTYRDANGQVWTVIGDSATCCNYSYTSNAYKAGIANSESGAGIYQSAITAATDPIPFRYYHYQSAGSGPLSYYIPVSQAATYKISLGFAEPGAGTTATQRKMDIAINGSTQGTVDPMVDAGATQKAVVKSYANISPMSDNGIYVIAVRVTKNASATLNPVISNIVVEKQ